MDRHIMHDPKDVELEHEISRYLYNLGIGEFHVSAKSGHVTVSGMVENFADKRKVTAEIRGLGGVHEMTNLVRVTGESTTMVNSDSNI